MMSLKFLSHYNSYIWILSSLILLSIISAECNQWSWLVSLNVLKFSLWDFIFLKTLCVKIIWVLLCKVYSSREDYYFFFNLPCICLEFISDLPYNVILVTEVLEIQFLSVSFQKKIFFLSHLRTKNTCAAVESHRWQAYW